jgi:hypothetical protein
LLHARRGDLMMKRFSMPVLLLLPLSIVGWRTFGPAAICARALNELVANHYLRRLVGGAYIRNLTTP